MSRFKKYLNNQNNFQQNDKAKNKLQKIKISNKHNGKVVGILKI